MYHTNIFLVGFLLKHISITWSQSLSGFSSSTFKSGTAQIFSSRSSDFLISSGSQILTVRKILRKNKLGTGHWKLSKRIEFLSNTSLSEYLNKRYTWKADHFATHQKHKFCNFRIQWLRASQATDTLQPQLQHLTAGNILTFLLKMNTYLFNYTLTFYDGVSALSWYLNYESIKWLHFAPSVSKIQRDKRSKRKKNLYLTANHLN